MGITRFTIDVHGQPRSLFSVIVRKDEITIGLKDFGPMERMGPSNGASFPPPMIPPSKVKEQRFSLHPSQKSAAGINVIKFTNVLASGRKDTVSHYTRAIKSADKFSLIIAHRSGNLDRPELIPRGKFTQVSLGRYSPDSFVLLYRIILSAPTLSFAADPALWSLNIIEHDFNWVKITVVWTFLTRRSSRGSFSTLPVTYPPDEEGGHFPANPPPATAP